MANVYDFIVKDRKGNEVSLEDYKGKVIARFEPTVDMEEVRKAVTELIG